MVDSSDDAIIGKTLDGLIISWNKGAERLYGYSPSEIIGRPIALLIPPDRPDELPQIMEQLRRGERVDHYHTERVRKDGSRISVSVTISPVHDSEGRIVGASAIARDVTEQERAVRDALELREEFVSIAAHELRTPLTAVIARLQLVERRLSRADYDRDALKRDVALVQRGAQKLRVLLERAFPEATELAVQDRTGGGDHFHVTVRAPSFDGMPLLDQHRRVNDALAGPLRNGTIHELRITTRGTT